MVDTTDFCIDDNNVDVTGTISRYNQLDGIHILDSNSGQVINNFVVSGDDGLVAHTIGAPTYNILYANNKVHGGIDTDGIQLAVGDFPIYNITIEDNDFYGSLFGIRSGYYDKGTGAAVRYLDHPKLHSRSDEQRGNSRNRDNRLRDPRDSQRYHRGGQPGLRCGHDHGCARS